MSSPVDSQHAPLQGRRNAPPMFLTALAWVVLFPLAVHAAPPIATEQNLRQAILGQGEFSQEQLGDMDLNSDGGVDAADLVSLLQQTPPGVPVATFDAAQSQVEEDVGMTLVGTSNGTLLD